MDSHAALETYLDFLDTSSTDVEKAPHPTPRIDSVLQHYWQRQQMHSDDALPSSTSPSDTLLPSASLSALADETSYESRLKQLEKQLSDLLQRSKVHVGSVSPWRHPARTKGSQSMPPRTSLNLRHAIMPSISAAGHHSSTDDSERSGSATPPRPTAINQPKKVSSKLRPSNKSHPSSNTHSSGKSLPLQGTAGKAEDRSHVRNSLHKKKTLTKPSTTKSKTSRAERSKAEDSSPVPRRLGHHSVSSGPGDSPHPVPCHTPLLRSPAEDRQEKTRLLLEARGKGSGREDRTNGATLQVLTKELDSERERRWKAEQAAGRLVEHVRMLQTRVTDTQRGQEHTVAMAAKLEADLVSERSTVQSLKDELKQLQEALSSSQEETGRLRQSEEEQVCALKAVEEEGRRREAQGAQERARMAEQLRESEQTASGHAREAELLRRSVHQLKQQLRQTQEVLAVRERAHQKELEHCRPPDGREVQEAVEREVEKERVRAAALQEEQGRRMAEQQEAYHRLEGEFREALRIEAARFQQLQRSYDEVCSEVDASRQTAVGAVQREQRATAMVTELTAMVKEQKGRITELTRSKQESVEVWRQRVGELEGEVATRNKVEVRLQTLQEENSRLSAQVTAQESVIAGLREERQLWGKELAHQGATLAQDRGRMEAQVEALLQEVKGLHQQTERDRDTLRIKEKMLEDQNETLHQLRQALASKEHELRSQQLSWQQEQQSLGLQLEQEEATVQDLQERLTAMAERKEQLKEELANAQEEVDQWQSKYSKLKAQWSDKVAAIDSLEHSLKQLQEGHSEKEAALVTERDQALQRARTAEGRLKSCDDAFREQLEAKQKSHDSHMTKLLEQKDREIHEANQRVLAVEGEMRELLSEVAREKKAMETKFQRLSRTFQELQQDMS